MSPVEANIFSPILRLVDIVNFMSYPTYPHEIEALTYFLASYKLHSMAVFIFFVKQEKVVPNNLMRPHKSLDVVYLERKYYS